MNFCTKLKAVALHMASSPAISIIGPIDILVGMDTWNVTCCHKAYHTEEPDTGGQTAAQGCGQSQVT